jgi:hypothetical protein
MDFTHTLLAYIFPKVPKQNTWGCFVSIEDRDDYIVKHNTVLPNSFDKIDSDFLLFFFYETCFIQYINDFIKRGYICVSKENYLSKWRDNPSVILMNIKVLDRSTPAEVALYFDKKFGMLVDFNYYFTFKEIFKKRIEENRAKKILCEYEYERRAVKLIQYN